MRNAVALVAAYAFVVNSLLATLLLSSLPVQGAQFVAICASSAGHLARGDAPGGAPKHAAHCTLCCLNFTGGLPAQQSLASERVALDRRREVPFKTRLGRIERTAQYYSRGPPKFA
jgi:hypothetical protein